MAVAIATAYAYHMEILDLNQNTGKIKYKVSFYHPTPRTIISELDLTKCLCISNDEISVLTIPNNLESMEEWLGKERSDCNLRRILDKHDTSIHIRDGDEFHCRHVHRRNLIPDTITDSDVRLNDHIRVC